MRMKILSLFASALLVTACATEPEGSGSASGSGSSTQGSGSGGTSTAPKATKAAPIGAPPGSGVDFYVNVGDRVFFDFDKSEIAQKAAATLKKQAAWLQKYPNKTIVVEGHCDERGTREYNLALGERRANAVREYLISLGVSAARIETISYGKERPAVLGSNDSAWAQNRRGVTLVRGGAGS
ncbi:MAG: peptidoglycan-associated lipoprotein Pal [Alphaproteobacteria bacterium]|nr:peptidoglycan-associated lipoprotein Pal [Alphaproteobacteria bacterium]